MRLTLRTLLAYRDRVLSPGDTEDLHRRIQQSDAAGNLLRRVDAVARLPKIPAPALDGKGLGGDANTVAEYLDDALNSTQVPEFERVCLVSDMQLAELAQCHELLSTALTTQVSVSDELQALAAQIGNPAERESVAAALRTRTLPRVMAKSVEAVGHVRSDAAHAVAPRPHLAPRRISAESAVDVASQAPMVASGGGSIKPQGLDLEHATLAHEVPEYLVGTKARDWRLALAIGGLAALFCLLTWQALGPWQQVAELFRLDASSTGMKNADVDSGATANSGVSPIAAADGKLAASSTDHGTGTGTDTQESVPPSVAGLESSATGDGLDEQTNSLAGLDEDVGVLPGNAAAVSAEPAVDISSPPLVGTATGRDPNEGVDTENDDGPFQPIDAADLGSMNLAPIAPIDTNRDAVPSSAVAVWRPSREEEQQAVLLARTADGATLVQPGQAITNGERLVVPPATQTTLDIAGGVLWVTQGPSLLQLTQSDNAAAGNVAVKTPLCKALLRAGPDGDRIELQTPCGNFQLQLVGGNSLVAVEVAYRPKAIGAYLDRRIVQPVVVLIVLEGSLAVSDMNGNNGPTQLSLGSGMAAVGDGKLRQFNVLSIPAWLRESAVRPIDRLGSESLRGELLTQVAADPNAVPALQSALQDRRPEVAALAAQTLLLLENWNVLAGDIFRNERLRTHWDNTISLSQQMLAVDPAQAAAIQDALANGFEQGDAGAVFQLLVGLSQDQMAAEGMSKLVGELENRSLPRRVLAAHRLKMLTGNTFGYLAYAPDRASISAWRRELARGTLEASVPSNPVWESVAK